MISSGCIQETQGLSVFAGVPRQQPTTVVEAYSRGGRAVKGRGSLMGMPGLTAPAVLTGHQVAVSAGCAQEAWDLSAVDASMAIRLLLCLESVVKGARAGCMQDQQGRPSSRCDVPSRVRSAA